MSDYVADTGAGTPNPAKDTKGKLLDADGRVIDQASQNATSILDQASDYIREQPISVVLLALGTGYILGRLKIL